MGILNVFAKKKEKTEEEEAKIDAEMKSSEEKYAEIAEEAEAKFVRERSLRESADSQTQMQKELELLKVQMQVMKELKLQADERFARINEEIGELRSTLIETEKLNAQIKTDAEKSIALIGSVQPDKLLAEVERLNRRIDELKEQQKRIEIFQDKYSEEMKDIRSKLEIVKGSETMLKLNEEVKREINELMKLAAKTEQQSLKVEAIFSEVQGRFDEYQILYNQVKDIGKSFRDLSKEVSVVKVKMQTAVSKSEFDNLQMKVNEKLILADKTLADLEKGYDEFRKIVEKSLADMNEEFTNKLESLSKSIAEVEEKKAELVRFTGKFEERLAGSKKEFQEAIEEKFAEYESLTHETSEKMEEVSEAVRKNKSYDEIQLEKLSSDIEKLKEKDEKELKEFQKEMKKLADSFEKEIAGIENEIGVKETLLRDELKQLEKSVGRLLKQAIKGVEKFDRQQAGFGREVASFSNRVKHLEKILQKEKILKGKAEIKLGNNKEK